MEPRTEINWMIFFAVISMLVVGSLTSFKFTQLEIQLHDTYYVVNSIPAILYTALTLYTFKNVYLLLDLTLHRYRILAVFIAIINLLVMLFLVIILGTAIHSMVLFDDAYPGADQSSRLVALTFIGGIMLFLVAIEVKAIKKLSSMIR